MAKRLWIIDMTLKARVKVKYSENLLVRLVTDSSYILLLCVFILCTMVANGV